MGLTLYFLRHGQTELSRADVFCGSGLDPELTLEGQQIAQAFTAAYSLKPWEAVFCSSLRRTIATAKPLCDTLAIESEVRDDLKEIAYGKWEGMTKANVEREYREDYAAWLIDPVWHAPTGGELAETIVRRTSRVIEEIRERFTNGSVLVVSHKATIRIILCSLLGIELGLFRYRLMCPVGSVSAVEFTPHGPLLHALADRGHLDERLRSLPGT